MKLGPEPTLIIYGILAALNAVQVLALDTPNWVHALIVAVSAGLAAVLNRSQVTPVAAAVTPSVPPIPPAAAT